MNAELSVLIDGLRASPNGFRIDELIREIEKGRLMIVDEDLREILSHRDGGGFILSERVVEILLRIASGRKISTALDFGCGVVGFVGKKMNPKPERIIALTQNHESAALSRVLCKGTGVEVACDALIAWLENTDLRFDCVFGAPPFGLKTELRLPHQKTSSKRKIDSVVAHMAWAGSCLADDGVGIFVVPTSFAENPNWRSLEILGECGLSLIAYLSLPPGVFLPNTAVSGALAVIARKKSERIFVGIFCDDVNRNGVIFRNFRDGREGRDVGTGRFVQPADFRGVRALEAQEQVDRTASLLGLAPTRLQDILVAVNLTKSSEPLGFEEQPNAVYLPLIGRGDAITSTGRFRMKPHNYSQLLVNPAVANSEYLAGFFNTPLGLSIREQSTAGVTIPKLSKATIGLMTVFLPAPDAQKTTVETQLRIREVSAELHELEKRLWEQPKRCDTVAKATERFERKDALLDWIDTLPFPLGSILWAYHTCGADERKRCDHLLDFFEAYGEFLAIILLSAFWRNQDLLVAELREIRVGDLKLVPSLTHAQFGTWMRIVERLGGKCRQFLAEPKAADQLYRMLCTQDREVVESLISVRVTQILNKANKRRNDWRHSKSVVADAESKSRHSELRAYLTDLRECMGVAWDRYELILPGKSDFLGETNRYSFEKVRGRCAPFVKGEAELTHQMKRGALYLKAEDERRALELIPLVRILPSPESVPNACYFYNRQESGGIRFVSYHFEVEAPVIESFSDTAQTITKLNAAFSDAP